MTCEHCKEARKNRDKFCKVCGEPVRSNPFYITSLLCIAIISIILVLELITGWVNLPKVLPGLVGLTADIIIIGPTIITLFEIPDWTMQIIFVVELIIVTICLFFCFKKTINALKERDEEKLINSPLSDVANFFCILFIIQVIYLMICAALGVKIDSVELGEGVKPLYSLLHASVYEEFLCRILLIGLPILIVKYMMKNKNQPWYRYLIGGITYERWMLIFIVASAFIFGWGHVDGWGLWKLFPTFLSGLVMSYLFIKHGVIASIGIHFLTNYMSMDSWLFNTSGIFAELLILAIIFSLPSFITYGKKLISFVKNKGNLQQS